VDDKCGSSYYSTHFHSTDCYSWTLRAIPSPRFTTAVTSLKIDRYVLETLMPDLVGHDKRASAFLVYLALWVLASESRQRAARASLRELAERTGLSKRAVQAALSRLERRKLVAVARAGPTAIAEYTVLRPWVRRAPVTRSAGTATAGARRESAGSANR
jgi:DNA-binding transcriptional ArsR family regulator